MSKITAGILSGIVFGLIHGFLNARDAPSAADVSASLLGRTSQGIITGVLAAYANRGATPLWRGAFWGIVIGAGLGVLAGFTGMPMRGAVLASGLVGLGCGLATAKARS